MGILDRFSLAGKTAIITGGSRGLGEQLALGSAEAGADVVVASRKLDNCKAVADHVADATGRRALPVACHVGSWDDCGRLVDTAYDEFGKIDILINNAGMSPGYDSLSDISEALYDKVLDV